MTTTSRNKKGQFVKGSKPKEQDHVCKVCGSSFKSRSTQSKFCSRRCIYKDRKNRVTYDSRNHRLKKYGLNEESYNKLFEEQGSKCKICFKKRNKDRYHFPVDHCHKTGKVRGILCSNCNRALGLFQDNTDILKNACDYIKESL